MSRCAHHGCACDIGEHVRYCSKYCQQSADGVAVAEALDMATCACGHVGCASEHERAAESRRPHENLTKEATC